MLFSSTYITLTDFMDIDFCGLSIVKFCDRKLSHMTNIEKFHGQNFAVLNFKKVCGHKLSRKGQKPRKFLSAKVSSFKVVEN